MLAIQDISVQFGGDVLFANMSFMVNKGDRIGLVGKNGADKSTLLKIPKRITKRIMIRSTADVKYEKRVVSAK